MSDQLSIPATGRVFVGYGAEPSLLGETIEQGAALARDQHRINVKTWRQLDIPGHFILEQVLAEIDKSLFVVADITRLNFNVVFEIAYALGTNKRVVLVLNTALMPPTREISQLGIFDTLGWAGYQNSEEFAKRISEIDEHAGFTFSEFSINLAAPVFLLTTLHKTDASIRTAGRLHKARLNFRSFDPKEQPRLSALEAFKGVASSVGVIAHLLSDDSSDHFLNNLRAAFVGGLAYGMEKELLLLQEGDSPVPLDYRDLVHVYQRASEIDAHVGDFAPKVTEALQKLDTSYQDAPPDVLTALDFGAPAAENEVAQLSDYYIETDEYHQVLSGTTRLVAGRKGSGKTALFLQSREQLQHDARNVVLDLKPEGHQFRNFKELVLQYLGESVKEHVATAFWEYVLLLEICRKLLELDAKRHVRDHTLFAPYRRLQELYAEDPAGTEGDFSQRILTFVDGVVESFQDKRGREGVVLDSSVVVPYMYKHDVKELRAAVTDYLDHRQSETWVLIDNIDKGWPTRGVEPNDIVILRGLLEASRKIERTFARVSLSTHTVVFLRNDVHELLLSETPDHGKESRVSMDWTDPELLKKMLGRRVISQVPDLKDSPFDVAWSQICESHVEGEASADFLVERSLMRPRNLINLMIHARGNAVNLGHKRITSTDIQKAAESYSADLCSELSLEIRDVFPAAGDDVVYEFLEAPADLTLADVYARLRLSKIDPATHQRCVEILLWFCFLGVVSGPAPIAGEKKVLYAYSVHYDMKKLLRMARSLEDQTITFRIHKAFWPFLEINRAQDSTLSH